MKKLYFIFLVILLQLKAVGQAVPNGNFESWSITPYDVPTGWFTSNQESFNVFGLPSVTKTNDSYSGYAVKVETIYIMSDTVGAYISNTHDNPMAGQGGVPYSQMPTHINGYYKYTLPGNDTALLLVLFKKNGSIVSSDLFKIKGTGVQTTYIPFSYPLSLSVVPDTVIVAAAASDLATGNNVAPGSMLWLDELSFTGSGTMPPIPNGNFESWTQATYDVAYDWNMHGDDVARTTDAFTGNNAIRLRTVPFPAGYITSGITTGYYTNNGPKGGRPYTNTQDTLKGYYKYFNTTGDSAEIRMSFSNNGQPVGWVAKRLPPVAVYTAFSIPFSLFNTPDSMRVEIESGNWMNQQDIGPSELYIDAIQLSSDPLGVLQLTPSSLLGVYPNPVIDEMRILTGDMSGAYNIYIYDVQNRLLQSQRLVLLSPGEPALVNVAHLQPGAYWFRICNDKICAGGKFIKAK